MFTPMISVSYTVMYCPVHVVQYYLQQQHDIFSSGLYFVKLFYFKENTTYGESFTYLHITNTIALSDMCDIFMKLIDNLLPVVLFHV